LYDVVTVFSILLSSFSVIFVGLTYIMNRKYAPESTYNKFNDVSKRVDDLGKNLNDLKGDMEIVKNDIKWIKYIIEKYYTDDRDDENR